MQKNILFKILENTMEPKKVTVPIIMSMKQQGSRITTGEQNRSANGL